MQWDVRGAYKADGADAQMTIDAPTQQAAEHVAAKRGIFVESCHPAIAAAAAVALPYESAVMPANLFGNAAARPPLQRIGLYIACGVGMLATFLPWVHAPIIGNVDGTKGGDGWLTLAAFAVAGMFCLLAPPGLVTGWRRAVAVTLALIVAISGVWKIIDFNQSLASMSSDPQIAGNPFAAKFAGALAAGMSIGVGIYTLVVAGIAVAIIAFAVRR